MTQVHQTSTRLAAVLEATGLQRACDGPAVPQQVLRRSVR